MGLLDLFASRRTDGKRRLNAVVDPATGWTRGGANQRRAKTTKKANTKTDKRGWL